MRKFIIILVLLCSTLNAQWENVSGNLPVSGSGFSLSALTKDVAIVSILYKLYRTDDGGEYWHPIAEEYDIVDIEMINGSTLIAAAEKAILKSNDSGVTWVQKFSGENYTNYFNYIEMFDEVNGIAIGDAYNSTSPLLIIKTTDGGETWSPINNQLIGVFSADTWKRFDFVNLTTGYIIPAGGGRTYLELLKSSDSGNTWESSNSPSYRNYVVKFANTQKGMMYSGDYLDPNFPKFTMTTIDGGKTWQTLPGVKSEWAEDIEFFLDDSDKVLLATKNKLCYSGNFGITWTDLTHHLNTDSNKVLRDIQMTEDGCCWLFGDDGRVFRNTSLENITGIETFTKELPSQFTLYQNYPNPFNPATEISYSLQSSGFVKLNIYNALGSLVSELVNKEQNAGHHNINFDASNLPSGIYYYRIITKGYSETKKMLLLK